MHCAGAKVATALNELKTTLDPIGGGGGGATKAAALSQDNTKGRDADVLATLESLKEGDTQRVGRTSHSHSAAASSSTLWVSVKTRRFLTPLRPGHSLPQARIF